MSKFYVLVSSYQNIGLIFIINYKFSLNYFLIKTPERFLRGFHFANDYIIANVVAYYIYNFI